MWKQKQKHGKFITIDGGEGSGKSSIVEFLKDELPRDQVMFTREPGGTEIAEAIRSLVLSKDFDEDINVVTELFLMCAARSQHVKNKILPALESGKDVISDRFSLSTYAYQLYGEKRLDLFSQVTQMDAMARGAVHNGQALIGGLKTDLQIILNVDVKVGLARMKSRKGKTNRFDVKNIAFHDRVREGFLGAVSSHNSAVLVNANNAQEVVQKEVLRLVNNKIRKS